MSVSSFSQASTAAPPAAASALWAVSKGARERLLVTLLRWAPKRTFSSVVGVLARRSVPRGVRRPLYTAFAHRVGANLDEVERPLEDYETFDEFFTRGLRAGVRPIAHDPLAIVSPCDGKLVEWGHATDGRLIQAKGHDYRLASLIPDAHAAARFEGGAYVTIYLAPRDYHRVHAPLDGFVNGFQHVPGASFPVNPLAVRHVDGLFALNERLITYMDSTAGEVAVVMVAATGVGHMTVTYDAVATRSATRGRPGPRVRFAAPRRIARAEELGAFHLGSTVILLFQAGRVKIVPFISGTPVKLGEAIGHRVGGGVTEARGEAA